MKQLQELDFEAKKKRYPNVPEHCLPKTKFKQSTANEITKSILRFLELNNIYCSRIQSQGQYQPKLGRFTKSTVRRGIGDLVAIINGKTVMIEVKAGKDKQSVWQKKTQKEVTASGGVYLVVRSFDEFEEYYNEKLK